MFAVKSNRLDRDGKIGVLWCTLMHDSPTWPIHGHYECRVCGRLHAVPWSEGKFAKAARLRQNELQSLRSA